LIPNEKTGRQQDGDTHRRSNGQPHFKLFVLGLVGGLFTLFFPVAEPVNAPGHEQYYYDIDDTGYPEGDDDGGVHRTPIRRQFSEPPRTPKMKYDRTNGHDEQNDCHKHSIVFPSYEGQRIKRDRSGPAMPLNDVKRLPLFAATEPCSPRVCRARMTAPNW
jgi:hypothetical protein